VGAGFPVLLGSQIARLFQLVSWAASFKIFLRKTGASDLQKKMSKKQRQASRWVSLSRSAEHEIFFGKVGSCELSGRFRGRLIAMKIFW